jgi:hypothetical protein
LELYLEQTLLESPFKKKESDNQKDFIIIMISIYKQLKEELAELLEEEASRTS